uniref:Uncharacterized protein n=1 Tax=Brassica oleracea TaxID=3712 RepID=A0A3P6C248_BRAOL|nr:unnamed protein product [Brassica oleracea]
MNVVLLYILNVYLEKTCTQAFVHIRPVLARLIFYPTIG